MNEFFRTFQSNILFLYNNFEKIQTSAKLFFTPVPYDVSCRMEACGISLMNVDPVKDTFPIGALLLGWMINPALFSIEKDGKRGFVFHSSGSTLSGNNNWTGVILETGEIVTGTNDIRFGERCEFLNFVIEKCFNNLKEQMKRKEMEHFNPYTLPVMIESC